MALLLSAHEMNTLLPAMDNGAVYLADGRAASGTTEEVVQPEVLSALYGHHVDVVRLHGLLQVSWWSALEHLDEALLAPHPVVEVG